MCERCGCGGGGATAVNLGTGKVLVLDDAGGHERGDEHVHADGTRHRHPHAAGHVHGRGHHERVGAGSRQHRAAHEPAAVVELETRVLARNDALAAANRAWLADRQVLALNLMSAPGAGKTTLLERTIRDLKDEVSLSVLEGDQATSSDGERIRAAGAAVVQINTGTGCHLDGAMVARGLTELNPGPGSAVFIENVGNLVCPALFDLGEHSRIVVLSATEGDDKPLKYPHMFAAADLLLINKVDLAPHVEFDMSRAIDDARRVNPDVAVLSLSARTGEGIEGWYEWLEAQIAAHRQARSGPHGG